MTDYWPSGLQLDDTETPLQILESARKDWENKSGGKLTLLLQQTATTEEDPMVIVHAQHIVSKRTVTLCSVIHRDNAPYPVRIQPRDNELPDFLRKTHYEPSGFAVNLAATIPAFGRTVENKWVCDTPAEFRQKLAEAFNSAVLKSDILSLVSSNEAQDGRKDQLVESETKSE